MIIAECVVVLWRLNSGISKKLRIFQRKTCSRPREGCETDFSLAELCPKIGLKVERSAEVSERVCKACERKIRNAYELYNFIRSSLQRENEANEILLAQQSDGNASDMSRFKRLLPLTVCLPDRTCGKNLPAKKPLIFAGKEACSSL